MAIGIQTAIEQGVGKSPRVGLDFCLRTQSFPWFEASGRQFVLSPDGAGTKRKNLQEIYGVPVVVQTTSLAHFLDALQLRFGAEALDWAIHGLAREHPGLSAGRVMVGAQKVCLVVTPAVLGILLWLAPIATGFALAVALAAAFAANAFFRAVLVWLGAAPTGLPAPVPAGDDLPRYSIIVPLYREANVVPGLIAALEALDYPVARMEILLVAEGDDHPTLAALRAAATGPQFAIVVVPPGEPRTKPKAANYALRFASGEFTVIYDAEDRPEPDQLRKAVAAFLAAPAGVACLQARLNFYNAKENLLSRLFALDYALWFDFLLPGLDRLHIPMPLGGTSNHFRTSVLRAISGWDPYNVTEDADLGIRLARLGMRVATLDSTTYEEATIEFGNWLRQRSRWMKGYMQTWLVHMRDPLALLRHAGPAGFLGFQLFVGGTFLTALLNPLLWGVFACSLFAGGFVPAGMMDAPFLHCSALGLLTGNALFTYLAMLGPYRRGWLELSPYGFLAPIYWWLVSVAAYRGLFQLISRPWHWEKTDHGRTRETFSTTPPAGLAS